MPKITLAAARVNAGLTQEDVAKALKVSNKTVSSWENGTSYPDAEQIEKLCELYGMHYDFIKFCP